MPELRVLVRDEAFQAALVVDGQLQPVPLWGRAAVALACVREGDGLRFTADARERAAAGDPAAFGDLLAKCGDDFFGIELDGRRITFWALVEPILAELQGSVRELVQKIGGDVHAPVDVTVVFGPGVPAMSRDRLLAAFQRFGGMVSEAMGYYEALIRGLFVKGEVGAHTARVVLVDDHIGDAHAAVVSRGGALRVEADIAVPGAAWEANEYAIAEGLVRGAAEMLNAPGAASSTEITKHLPLARRVSRSLRETGEVQVTVQLDGLPSREVRIKGGVVDAGAEALRARLEAGLEPLLATAPVDAIYVLSDALWSERLARFLQSRVEVGNLFRRHADGRGALVLAGMGRAPIPALEPRTRVPKRRVTFAPEPIVLDLVDRAVATGRPPRVGDHVEGIVESLGLGVILLTLTGGRQETVKTDGPGWGDLRRLKRGSTVKVRLVEQDSHLRWRVERLDPPSDTPHSSGAVDHEAFEAFVERVKRRGGSSVTVQTLLEWFGATEMRADVTSRIVRALASAGATEGGVLATLGRHDSLAVFPAVAPRAASSADAVVHPSATWLEHFAAFSADTDPTSHLLIWQAIDRWMECLMASLPTSSFSGHHAKTWTRRSNAFRLKSLCPAYLGSIMRGDGTPVAEAVWVGVQVGSTLQWVDELDPELAPFGGKPVLCAWIHLANPEVIGLRNAGALGRSQMKALDHAGHQAGVLVRIPSPTIPGGTRLVTPTAFAKMSADAVGETRNALFGGVTLFSPLITVDDLRADPGGVHAVIQGCVQQFAGIVADAVQAMSPSGG